jgi:diguanylate cyclase (GGDEF)-like protein
MSLCSHCRTVTAPADEGGVLRLTHPLPHTVGKLRKVLSERYRLECDVPDGLGVVLPAGSRDDVVDLLERTLSASERQACKVLFLNEGETLTLDKLSSVQPLDAFIAKARSGWLVEMLNQDTFYADFQPIVSAASPTTVFAYECLLRGRDEEGKTVPPDMIFEAARGAELLFQVDRAARLTAIRDASAHGVSTPIFINFNSTSIYAPAFCLRTTIKAIQEAGITPERIIFEVVESDQVGDTEHLLNIIKFYRQQGFRIALDDLGAGYGSLNLLSSLKPDFVKFDRELIQGVDGDPYKQKVFTKLVEMARDLGIHTIAEGIETEGEYRWLAEQGVEYLQGYFFARPASPPPPSAPILSHAILPRSLTSVVAEGVPLSLEPSMDSEVLQGVLNSLHEHVALIEPDGKIRMVNHAWRQFGLEGGMPEGASFTGVNYLDVCHTASHDGLEDALNSYNGIRDVLDGVSDHFSLEYPCDTPQRRRWFLMSATPFSSRSGGAVILHMDITERKAQEAKIHRLAHYDELTGVANRRLFYEEAQQVLAEAERELLPFSLLYLDLDDFKSVNDRYGHTCGDELLRHVSARLQGLTRKGDLLARLGGDEFVILLRSVSNREVEAVAARYRAALGGPFIIDGRQLSGVASLGTVSYPEQGQTIDELLRHVDAAMYREKAEPRKAQQAGMDKSEARLLP